MHSADIAVIAVLSMGVLILLAVWYNHRKNMELFRIIQTYTQDDRATKVLVPWLQEMRGSLDRNTETLQGQLDKTNRAIAERLDNATSVVSSVGQELGKVQELGRQIRDFQNFLRAPKLRGNVGEQILRDLLAQILPTESFRLQHRFSTGQIVDAIITTDKGLIPIDAKFPMENFHRYASAENDVNKEQFARLFARDIKRHVDDISQKYIVPDELTVDFAIMYLPSEAVYYEIMVNNDQIWRYAQDRNVLVVSPNSFYYLLQIILIGLEGKRLEQATLQILTALNSIRQDASKVTELFQVLNTHITNAKNAMDRSMNEYQRLIGKIEDTKYLKNN